MLSGMGMPIGQRIDAAALQERRLAARKLLDEGVTQAEVARRLDVSRQSVSRWAEAPAKELAAIRRFGRKSTIDDRLLGRLRQALLAGAKRQGYFADVWTLPRVRTLIVKLGGPSFSTVHVWRLLGRMGFSPQRPTGRARERNEEAIATWKAQEWPRLKKKPSASVAPSSSSTRVV
jgi:transposase